LATVAKEVDLFQVLEAFGFTERNSGKFTPVAAGATENR
jgi:hypothetical protein